jgi:hypothetical protein
MAGAQRRRWDISVGVRPHDARAHARVSVPKPRRDKFHRTPLKGPQTPPGVRPHNACARTRAHLSRNSDQRGAALIGLSSALRPSRPPFTNSKAEVADRERAINSWLDEVATELRTNWEGRDEHAFRATTVPWMPSTDLQQEQIRLQTICQAHLATIDKIIAERFPKPSVKEDGGDH